jgi:hypothetical protein
MGMLKDPGQQQVQMMAILLGHPADADRQFRQNGRDP